MDACGGVLGTMCGLTWRLELAGKEKELRETRRKLASEMENKDNEYATTERELRLRLKTVEDDLSMLYDFKAHKKELEAKLRDQEQQVRAANHSGVCVYGW